VSLSTAVAELNAKPVAFTPTRRRTASTPTAAQTSAKTNGFETLMMGKTTSASPVRATWPVTDTTLSPNRSGSAAASTGYTDDRLPEWSAARRWWTSARASATSVAGGSRPAET